VADRSGDITVQLNDPRGRLSVEQVTLKALETALDEIRLLNQNARDLVSGSPSPRQARATPASQTRPMMATLV
jgi:hypothetical protein